MAGRPTLYNDSMPDALLNYFKGHPYTEDGPDGKKVAAEYRTIEGFCMSVGITRTTLNDWCKDEDKPLFSDAYEFACNWQLEYLQQNGITGRTQPNITKLLLSARHNIVEKTATDLNHAGAVNVTIQSF